MKKCILLITTILFVRFLFAQNTDKIVYENYCYVEDIATVQCFQPKYPYALPVMTLNSEEKLQLSFDDLSGESRYLKYTFIHCSHDWKPDALNQLEYLDGFMEDEITDYSYSFNTIVSYTHYSLDFPTDMMRITKSGNYILYVYDDTQDQPVLTRRFMVMEPQPAGVYGEVKQASDVTYMFVKQEVDFVVNTGGYQVHNPAQYLHASIVQNGRWDNAIVGLRYRSGKPGEYRFDYDNNANAMNGGDDWRYFDTKSLRYNGHNIYSIGYRNGRNLAFLIQDEARPYGAYESQPTLNGYYYIKNEDFSGTNTEDYVHTIFTLHAEFPIRGGDVYVFGALTDWQILPEAKLHQNKANGLWEAVLLLKQGFYDYQYVYVPTGSKQIDETFIEGSHWETPNYYTVLVYLQEEGGIYDKLIGMSVLQLTK